jgi:SHS2 domain-containing protein
VSFELRDHTADVAVEASGESLDAVVAAVADGMAAAMCDEVPTEGGDRFELTVAAESREALLFDYLDELIYERDVRVVLPVDNEAAVSDPSSDGGPDEWVLSGSARGVPLERVEARDLKAVTYSDMDLSETADGWHAYVVFDV